MKKEQAEANVHFQQCLGTHYSFYLPNLKKESAKNELISVKITQRENNFISVEDRVVVFKCIH
jgi:hypothetical protein